MIMLFFSQWHALERSEQAKYYEMARREKELHQQMYPGWSARDNYATRTKKKKMKTDVSAITSNYETKLGGLLSSLVLLRSLVTCVSVTTRLAAAKPGRLVLSQFVQCE